MVVISPTAEIAKDAVLDVENLEVGSGATIDAGVEIRCAHAQIGEGVRIGRASRIEATELNLGDNTEIGPECTFDTHQIRIGSDTWIGRDCHFAAIRARADELVIGDDVFIGPSTNVLTPILVMGDYIKLNNHVLINGYAGCYIGHNTWIGQNCLLNAADDLIIGNNVSLGIATCVFTHAYAGELLEGCQVHTVAPTTIEDNVWTAGPNHMIGPGVTIGSRTMILPNAVVSGDVPPGSCVGGVPAKDLSDQIEAFIDLRLEEKLELMRRFVDEFVEEAHPGCYEQADGGYTVRPADGSESFTVRVLDELRDDDELVDELGIIYAGRIEGAHDHSRLTVFDVATKQYGKLRTKPERQIIAFMNGYRARFAPRTRPRIQPSTQDS
ncbi:MAG: hypothetical protein ACXWH0_16005 [Acidimicrobiia bacterium]